MLDANGDQALIRREYTTAAAVPVRLTLAAEGFTTDRNPGFFAYNTVFYTVRTTDAVALNSCVLTRTQADALLAGGADYRDLARSETSVNWPAEDVAAANMEEGCTSVSENCLPKTTYVIVVLATDVNGGERLEHTDVTTAAEPAVPPVTSELFEKLPGM